MIMFPEMSRNTLEKSNVSGRKELNAYDCIKVAQTYNCRNYSGVRFDKSRKGDNKA